MNAYEGTAFYEEEEIKEMKGTINAEVPDRLLHIFSGNITLEGGKTRPLTSDNLLLRVKLCYIQFYS